MVSDRILRDQLVALLHKAQAHLMFEDAVADFPLDKINTPLPNLPYTPWELLEHIRITQWDILDFIRNPGYVWPKWPDDYWPQKGLAATPQKWQDTITAFQVDRAALMGIIQDPAIDLTADLPHAPGYSVLREILVVADHNAYHIGEFAILRQVMGTWPPGHT